ncbi:DUF222 domain-containing protein, partial [Cellulomonas marina]|uniref:DUF222 domain-containing protein n=1 Tax=Cellulomonas marina TaxID=988821 RepID=UPI00194401B5
MLLAAAVQVGALADEVSCHVHGRPVTAQSRDLAGRSVRAELATVLQVPEGTATGLVSDAVELVGSRPAVLSALAQGRVSYPHVLKLLEETASLPVQVRVAADAALLPGCVSWTPVQLGRRARSWVARHHPEPVAVRHRRACADRHVWVTHERDGMAWLHALLPAVQAVAIFEGLSFGARMLAAGADEGADRMGEGRRLVGQLRADLLAEVLLPELTGTTTEHQHD